MQTKHYIWLAAAVGLIIGIGAWFIFKPAPAVAPSNTASSTGQATTTTTDLGNGVSVESTGGGTVEAIPAGTPAPKPPTLVALTITADLPADAKQALQTQFDTYYKPELTKAPTRTDLWLKLGTVYKIAGQYDAAITAWTYVATAGNNTVNYVAYGNLGDLYLNFIHNYAKAEASYKAALAIKPGVADYQAGLKAAQSAQQ